MKRFLFFISIFSLILFVSCGRSSDSVNNKRLKEYKENQPDSCDFLDFEYNDYEIALLDQSELPYNDGAKVIKTRGYSFDDNMVPLHNFKGVLNYHPVYTAQYGLHLIDVFKTVADSTALSQAKSIGEKLLGIAIEKDSAYYFPYSFDFPLHGQAVQTEFAPWYSSMAQGQILSFYCRMFSVTQDSTYLTICDKTYKSFSQLKGKDAAPWLSCIDENKNLWLEEYPLDLPCLTLNGMIFAIYGVYDYYLLTKDEDALITLKAAITTIENNIERFRNEGEVSSYCIKHRIQSDSYHAIHIEQLRMLNRITGVPYFSEMADIFESDTPEEEEEE